MLDVNKRKPIWLVRAGRNGEQEAAALEHSVVAIGWDELGDLSTVKDKERLLELFEETYPNSKPKAIENKANQVWKFRSEIKVGDIVVLPLKQEPAIAVGVVKSAYMYKTDLSSEVSHMRKIEWITKDMPRTRLDQDLLYSLGAFLTVCRIQRNEAEVRIPATVNAFLSGTATLGKITSSVDAKEENVDLETLGRDQIRVAMERGFAGHRLQDLITSIQSLQGLFALFYESAEEKVVHQQLCNNINLILIAFLHQLMP